MVTSSDTQAELFSLQNAVFRYHPFPIAITKQVFSSEIYDAMVENWPDTDSFRYMPNLGHKYSLSEVNHPAQYYNVIKTNPIWQKLYDEIKSEKFIFNVLDFLTSKNVDIGWRNRCLVTNKPSLKLATRIKGAFRGAALLDPKTVSVKSRFEFSMLPGNGGSIRPHTDAQSKYITLVVAIVKAGEWKKSYGGGTSVLQPKDMTRNFNDKNDYLEFDEMERLETYEFNPNQCVIFIKTFNSWHAVEPLTAPDSSILRKSLTINIEASR